MFGVSSKELLLRMVQHQATNARTWIQVFKEYKDFSSMRNATEALARWYGMYKSYRALCDGEEDACYPDFDEFRVAREEIMKWQPSK